MANPQLTKEQRESLFVPLFKLVRAELERLSSGNPELLFALRRKLFKELTYLERDTPAARNKLKALKFKEQHGLCVACGKILPKKGAELDRLEAKLGYTADNTRLLHHDCHIEQQKSRNYC